MEITHLYLKKVNKLLHYFNVVNVNIAILIVIYLNILNETKIKI
jgi:hypothetical protein